MSRLDRFCRLPRRRNKGAARLHCRQPLAKATFVRLPPRFALCAVTLLVMHPAPILERRSPSTASSPQLGLYNVHGHLACPLRTVTQKGFV